MTSLILHRFIILPIKLKNYDLQSCDFLRRPRMKQMSSLRNVQGNQFELKFRKFTGSVLTFSSYVTHYPIFSKNRPLRQVNRANQSHRACVKSRAPSPTHSEHPAHRGSRDTVPVWSGPAASTVQPQLGPAEQEQDENTNFQPGRQSSAKSVPRLAQTSQATRKINTQVMRI